MEVEPLTNGHNVVIRFQIEMHFLIENLFRGLR